MEIQNYILIFESILLLLLAFYVLFRNPKQAINISFFVMVFGAAVWVMSNGIFEEIQLKILGKITFTGAILIAVGFSYFSYLFPFKRRLINRLVHLIVLVPAIFLNIVLYTTDSLVGDVISEDTLSQGFFYHVFAVYFIILWGWGIYELIKKYQRADGLHHWQLKNTFYALSVSLIAGVTTNLIMPWIFHNQTVGWVGPMFSIFFFGFLSYILFKKNV